MLRLAVIGKDVSQSQSPVMHAFILARFHEECRYDKISLPCEEFDARVGELFSRYDAFNVTIPFKTQIIPHLKELRDDAAAFDSVNTVLARDRAGYNTDGYGFMMMLSNAGIEVAAKSALVLGAGGSGRSCIKKLTEAGAEVFAYSRTFERLRKIFGEFGGFTPLDAVPLRPFDLVINCTGIGMHDTVGKTPSVRFQGGAATADDLLLQCGTAVDLIYEPKESAFLKTARSHGKKTVNGEAMLFYQAYMADCIFVNKTPDAAEAKALWEEYTEGTK